MQVVKKISNPIILLIFLLVSGMIYASLHASNQTIRQSKQNLLLLEEAVAQQAREVAQLETQLEDAQQPLSKERIIRDELLLQKEGELVLKLPEILIISPSPTPRPPQPEPWQEWKELLF